MRALEHDDEWTQKDEDRLVALCEARVMRTRAGRRGSRSAPARGQPLNLIALQLRTADGGSDGAPSPRAGSAKSVDDYRAELQRIRSEVVPFEEPLVFALDRVLASGALKPPPGVPAVSPRHRLCLLQYGFDLRPADHEAIKRIELCLTYRRPKALTYSMVPNTELEERFKLHTTVNLAVEAEAAVETPALVVAPFVVGRAGARAHTDNSVTWSWTYNVLKAKVVAYGSQSGYAEWHIARKGLVGAIELRAIVRMPTSADRLSLEVTGMYKVSKRGLGRLWQRTARIRPARVTGTLVP